MLCKLSWLPQNLIYSHNCTRFGRVLKIFSNSLDFISKDWDWVSFYWKLVIGTSTVFFDLELFIALIPIWTLTSIYGVRSLLKQHSWVHSLFPWLPFKQSCISSHFPQRNTWKRNTFHFDLSKQLIIQFLFPDRSEPFVESQEDSKRCPLTPLSLIF